MFRFKKFSVCHDNCAMKVGTDGVLLGAWTESAGEKILDIGTGSGLISLMLAQRNNLATIVGVEINVDAEEQAKENFAASPWSQRLKAIRCDISEYNPGEQYDLIVANPPFFINSTPSTDTAKHNVRHNSLLTFNDLALAIDRLLKPEGIFSVILPAAESKVLTTLLTALQFNISRMAEFIPRKGRAPERILLSFSRNKVYCQKQVIYHYDDKDWSEQYKMLTKDFYLKL